MVKNIVQAKQWLDKCYSDPVFSETTVKRWHTEFKSCRTDTNDAERSGRTNSAVASENKTKKKLHKLVLANRKLKLCVIVEELRISEGSVFTILHEHLSMRKLCSKWVPRLFTVDQQQRVDDSEVYLKLFQHNKKRSFCVNM